MARHQQQIQQVLLSTSLKLNSDDRRYHVQVRAELLLQRLHYNLKTLLQLQDMHNQRSTSLYNCQPMHCRALYALNSSTNEQNKPAQLHARIQLSLHHCCLRLGAPA